MVEEIQVDAPQSASRADPNRAAATADFVYTAGYLT